MSIIKMIGTLFIVPTTVLLTISYFVVVVNSKIQEKPIKVFGWVIAVLLWIAALAVLTTGMYVSAKGPGKMNDMKCGMMKSGMMKSPMMDQKGMMPMNMERMKSGGHKGMMMKK